MRVHNVFVALAVIVSMVATVEVAGAGGRPDEGPASDAGAVFDYWNSERVAAALPRDFVIDHRGLGYLRGANGSLSPYGHGSAALALQLHSSLFGPQDGLSPRSQIRDERPAQNSLDSPSLQHPVHAIGRSFGILAQVRQHPAPFAKDLEIGEGHGG